MDYVAVVTDEPDCIRIEFKLPPRYEIADLGSKLAAKLILSDRSNRIIVPSREEWIGVGLLDRDDELTGG